MKRPDGRVEIFEQFDELDRLFERRNQLTPALSAPRLNATMRELRTQPIARRSFLAAYGRVAWVAMFMALVVCLFSLNIALTNPVVTSYETATAPSVNALQTPTVRVMAITPLPAAKFSGAVATMATVSTTGSYATSTNFPNIPQPFTLSPKN